MPGSEARCGRNDETVAKTRSNVESWDGVDRGLFDHLRAWRKRVAGERGMPPFLVLDDHALRDFGTGAADRRTALLRGVHGIGVKPIGRFWFLRSWKPSALIAANMDLTTNQIAATPAVSVRLAENPISKSKGATQEAAFLDVRAEAVRSTKWSTACNRAAIDSIWSIWLNTSLSSIRRQSTPGCIPACNKRVTAAAAEAESARLKPIFEKLGGEVPYEEDSHRAGPSGHARGMSQRRSQYHAYVTRKAASTNSVRACQRPRHY